MSKNSPTGTTQNNARDELIKDIVNLKHPGWQTWEMLKSYSKTAEPLPYLEKVKAFRAELTTKPEAELLQMRQGLRVAHQQQLQAAATERQRKKAEKEAAKEAARFYNRPEAQADFAYWGRMDYWTFDEAIALLLGRDPRVVTWRAVKAELDPVLLLMTARPEPTEFLKRYDSLRSLASRAQAMTASPNLRPQEVVRWAVQRAGVQPPAKLVAVLSALEGSSQAPRAPVQPSSASVTVPVSVTAPAPPPAPVPVPVAVSGAAAPQAAHPVTHSMKAKRRDALAPVIEEAQRRCKEPYDPAAVWAVLLTMAERQEPPLRGCTEDGIQYLRDGAAATLTRDALNKRIQRSKERS